MGYLKTVGYRLLGVGVFFALVWAVTTFEEKANTTAPQVNISPTAVLMPTPTKTRIPPTIDLFNDLRTAAAEYQVPESIKQSCILWSDVTANHVHSGVCVYGAIDGWGVNLAEPSLTAISFGEGIGSLNFYVIAPEPDWTKDKFSAGDCVVIRGDITTDVIGAPKIDGREYKTSITPCSEGIP